MHPFLSVCTMIITEKRSYTTEICINTLLRLSLYKGSGANKLRKSILNGEDLEYNSRCITVSEQSGKHNDYGSFQPAG